MLPISGITAYQKVDITGVTNSIMKDGLIQIHPFEFYKQFTRTQLVNFFVEYGVYVLPTAELIAWLKANIRGKAIEIGAGNGAIARALQIPATDSYMQAEPAIIAAYATMGQKPIVYPSDVEKLNYSFAIKKYKPETVIGAFITHKYNGIDGNALGVNEGFILNYCKRYIMIGNLDTHKTKPLLKRLHNPLYFPWLITRSQDYSKNRIFVFDN